MIRISINKLTLAVLFLTAQSSQPGATEYIVAFLSLYRSKLDFGNKCFSFLLTYKSSLVIGVGPEEIFIFYFEHTLV